MPYSSPSPENQPHFGATTFSQRDRHLPAHPLNYC
jgi:hypothetical protein